MPCIFRTILVHLPQRGVVCLHVPSTRGLRAVYSPATFRLRPCTLRVRSVCAPCALRVCSVYASVYIRVRCVYIRVRSVYIRVTCGLHQGYLRFKQGLHHAWAARGCGPSRLSIGIACRLVCVIARCWFVVFVFDCFRVCCDDGKVSGGRGPWRHTASLWLCSRVGFLGGNDLGIFARDRPPASRWRLATRDSVSASAPGWILVRRLLGRLRVCSSGETQHARGAADGGRADVCSLRNKRPNLSGRPHCRGVAIGVARRGARRSGERTLRIPPSCSDPVSHSSGPHVASFVGRPCVLARLHCERRWRRARAGYSRQERERGAARGAS